MSGIAKRLARPLDETAVCGFRHLLEKRVQTEPLFAAVSKHLKERRTRLSLGTIVDATIMAAPASIKCKDVARDPEMHPTKKGKPSHFG